MKYPFLIPVILLVSFQLQSQELFPDMVTVKGGNFKMGSTGGAKDEQPVHEVFLEDFYIGRFEVTQDQWKTIMDQDTSQRYFKGCGSCPVERVSWYNAIEFIMKLNEMTGNHYRLPTEAEWEFAARGGTLSKKYRFSGSNSVEPVAWKDGNSDMHVHPVGRKRPNELGIFDMSGNVFEWCSDWYSPDWYRISGNHDPVGPDTGTYKVIRGGSWYHDHTGLRVMEREKANPWFRYGFVGFRLCLPANERVVQIPVNPVKSNSGSSADGTTARIIYTGNEGFLITTKNRKILIDAIFGGLDGNWCDQPGDSVLNLMIKGMAPFDSIDIVLVTHNHPDHFNPTLTLEFLENHEESFLICPEQVKGLLVKDERFSEVSGRIIAINPEMSPDFSLTIKGISIRALCLRHGSWMETDSATGRQTDLHQGIQNLGYSFNADGFSFFHSGDCSTTEKESFRKYRISEKPVDVVFLDRVFLGREGTEIINEYLPTKTIVLMHIEPGRRSYYQTLLEDFPVFYIPSVHLESKTFEK